MIIRLLLTLFISLHAVSTWGQNNENQLQKLDNAMLQAPEQHARKAMKIDMLRRSLQRSTNDNERLSLCYDIYNEYYVLQFDSALYYINKVHDMAIKTGNRHYQQLAIINKAELLGMGGFYPQAIALLDSVSLDDHDHEAIFKSHIAHFHIYLY